MAQALPMRDWEFQRAGRLLRSQVMISFQQIGKKLIF